MKADPSVRTATCLTTLYPATTEPQTSHIFTTLVRSACGTLFSSACPSGSSRDGSLRGEWALPTEATAIRMSSRSISLLRLIREILTLCVDLREGHHGAAGKVILSRRFIRPISRRGREWRRRAETGTRVGCVCECLQNRTGEHSR